MERRAVKANTLIHGSINVQPVEKVHKDSGTKSKERETSNEVIRYDVNFKKVALQSSPKAFMFSGYSEFPQLTNGYNKNAEEIQYYGNSKFEANG